MVQVALEGQTSGIQQVALQKGCQGKHSRVCPFPSREFVSPVVAPGTQPLLAGHLPVLCNMQGNIMNTHVVMTVWAGIRFLKVSFLLFGTKNQNLENALVKHADV